MSGGNFFRADSVRHFEKLVELDEVIAERARDGRAAVEIVLHEGLHHLLFKAVLEVDHVIRDAEHGGDEARIVHVVKRTATPDALRLQASSSGKRR